LAIKKIHWNVSTDCNMACRFCYLWRNGHAGQLSTDSAKELIRQSASAGVQWFVFGGGDPLMRKDLPELVSFAKESGLKVDIQTNGILLNDSILKSIAVHVDRLGLSLDGEDAQTHDRLRRYPGHYATVIDALDTSNKYGMNVTLRTTVMKANLDHLSGLGRLVLANSSIRKWSIREFVPLGRGADSVSEFLVSREEFFMEYANIVNRNSALCSKIPVVPLSAEDMQHCYCLVSPSGHVYSHPDDGAYVSTGKFPEENLLQIFSKIDYDSSLRKTRDEKAAVCAG